MTGSDARAVAWEHSVSVFPLSPGSKVPYKGFGWEEYQTRKATLEERQEWRRKYPGCNWALVTGEVSGIVGLDWDKDKGRALRKERSVYGGPATVTPNGGFHTLHRHPGRNVPNKAKLLGDDTGGLDVRGDGGYLVIPPSSLDGRSYRWEIPPWMNDLPPLPEWSLELIEGQRESRSPSVAAPVGTCEQDGLPPGVGEGQRNQTAASIVGRYLAKGLRPEEVWPIVQAWNGKNRPPLAEDELRSILYSIARKERERSAVIELVDSGTLSTVAGPPKEYLVEPFFPAGGKVFLAGWQGSFKSVLMLNMAVSMNNELPLFGRFKCRKGRVLYIDRENTPHEVDERVKRITQAMHTVRSGITFQFPKEKPDLADRRTRERYIKIIEDGRYDLVVFDSFLCFFNLRNESDNTEVRNVLELVGEIPAKTGCAVLFIDHATKPTPDKLRAGIKVTPRGAGAKGDWSDVVLTLEHRDHEARTLRTLRFSKVRYCAPVPAMVLEVGTNLVFSPSGLDELCPPFTVRQVVDDHPSGIRASDLYEKLEKLSGCGRRTAINATQRTVELQFIRREERGRTVLYLPASPVLVQ